MAALQLTLFERAHYTAFTQWVQDNPHVWALFVKFTFEVIKTGRHHYSADAICHRIRWHVDVDTQDPSGWKINNNHVAFLARRFERQFPQYAGFFQTRVQKAAK